MTLTILHIEDSPADAELVKREITKAGIVADITVVNTGEEFISLLEKGEPDVILCDHSLPQFNSVIALEIFKKYNYDSAFILVTGSVSEEFAVNSLKNGANDYILKSSLKRLPSAIYSAIEKGQTDKARRTALQQLKESEARFKLLINTIREGVLYTDLEERIIYANEQFCAMTGFPHSELVGNLTYDVLPDYVNKQVILEQMDLRKKGISSSYRIQLKKNDKNTWVAINANPVFDENGILIGSIKSSVDITKEIEAEEKLQNEKMFLNSVVQNIYAGIVACDRNGNAIFHNKQFLHFLQQDNSSEISCKKALEELKSNDEETAFTIMMKALKGVISENIEFIIQKNNLRNYLSMNCTPLHDQSGELTGALAVFHELTTIKNLEQAKFVNVFEGEEKERQRIARELHDGLSQLLVAAKMNLSGLSGLIESADEQIEKMLNGATELLDNSIHEVRSISHNLSPVALQHGLVRALEGICKQINHNKGLKINYTSDIGSFLIPETHQHLLYRSTQEILSNIIKHACAREVTIKLFCIENKGVCLEVCDNGTGFDLKTALNDNKGIGLRNLHSRVRAFNGDISIHSEPGNTMYRILVPVQ